MDSRFSPEIYRRYSLDLRGMSDEELAKHFQANPGERRIYGGTTTTAEFMSMRWLRGHGLEVGAGKHPTPLFGNAVAVMADCDDSLSYGGERLDWRVPIDAPSFSAGGRRFDFSIASHVLEHADSFIHAFSNLVSVTVRGGIVYIVLPDIEFLHDRVWLPKFDFIHHVEEFIEPLKYASWHDDLYIRATYGGIENHNEHAELSSDYREAVKAGKLPQEMRFMHHKHNYTFGDWTGIIIKSIEYLGGPCRLLDARYGYERMDCHYVFQVV